MISIIISSANAKLLESAILNVKETIGVPFEILSFDNSKGEMGICEIYNKGALAAKYDVLCYMHEDLNIHTKEWGKEVLTQFNEGINIGLIGVAGCAYKSFAPSGWGIASQLDNLIFSNYLQSFKRTDKPSALYYVNLEQVAYAPVVCIDGMWFCTLKSIALECKFDQELLQGFHCYDIDYCLSVSQRYEVIVTFNVLMEHFSEGGYSRSWLDDTLKLHAKWQHTLPRSVMPISESEGYILEKRAYKRILQQMNGLGYSFKEMAAFLYKYYKTGEMDIGLYLKLLYYGLKYPSKKENA